MTTARFTALVFIAALTGGSAVQAQEPPSAPAAQHAWDPAQMHARMEARHAARLHALHEVLGIRPDQEAAFAAFAAATRRPEHAPGARTGDMGADRAAIANLTTPERLDRMAQRMRERTARRQDAFARRAAATKALYAVLGPDQRRTLDALPMLRGGHRGGWGHGHGMDDRGWGHRGMDGHGQG